MEPRELKELRSRAQGIDATVHVSSPELKGSLIDEVVRQLKKRRLVKVKLLKGCKEKAVREELAGELARQTGSTLVEVRGNTVVLFRERADD